MRKTVAGLIGVGLVWALLRPVRQAARIIEQTSGWAAEQLAALAMSRPVADAGDLVRLMRPAPPPVYCGSTERHGPHRSGADGTPDVNGTSWCAGTMDVR